jgi:hypothetical protein
LIGGFFVRLPDKDFQCSHSNRHGRILCGKLPYFFSNLWIGQSFVAKMLQDRNFGCLVFARIEYANQCFGCLRPVESAQRMDGLQANLGIRIVLGEVSKQRDELRVRFLVGTLGRLSRAISV